MKTCAVLRSMLARVTAFTLALTGASLLDLAPGKGLAAEGPQDLLYVTAQDKLLVVDPTSLRVMKTVNVGGSLAGAVSTADGRLLYVANSAREAVMVVDTATSQVIDLVPVGINPVGPVVLAPDEKTVWVVSEEAISVIDAAAHKLVASVPLDNGISSGLAFAPSGDSWRAYVSSPQDNTVVVIDARTYAVLARIPVGKAPWRGVVYSKYTGKVYVANTRSQNLSVIDVSTNKVVNTIPLPRPGFNIAITPDGRYLFLDSRWGETVRSSSMPQRSRSWQRSTSARRGPPRRQTRVGSYSHPTAGWASRSTRRARTSRWSM